MDEAYLIVSNLGTALLSGGLVQLLNIRSIKRVKSAEADIKEIESLRDIIETNRDEINRLVKRNTDLEQKYVELQREFIAMCEDITKLRAELDGRKK